MPFAASRPVPRPAGPARRAARAVVCVNGGTSAEMPGTWSASVEWLVRRLSAPLPRPRLPRGALPDQVVAAARALRRGRARPRSTRPGRAGLQELALLGFSMGGAVAVRNAAAAGVELVAGVNPWLPPQLELETLRGRRLAIAHGALDAPLPLIPGVKPSMSLAAAERARALGVEVEREVVSRGFHAVALRRRDGGMLALPGRGALRRVRRRPAGALLRVGLYLAIRRATHVAARLLYRVEIVGSVPPGPVIVAANHESLLDPPLLALVARQPLHFLAKVELWRYRPGAWLMDALGGIPIRRDRRDLLSVGRAEELLRAGESVAIFPQGTVQGGAWTRGAARLALATGAPLVPVTIIGTKQALSRGRIALLEDPARRRRADPGRAGEADGRGREGADRRARAARRRGALAGPYAVTDATRTSARVRLRGAAGASCRSGGAPCLPAPDRRPLPALPPASRGVLGADPLLVRARRHPRAPAAAGDRRGAARAGSVAAQLARVRDGRDRGRHRRARRRPDAALEPGRPARDARPAHRRSTSTCRSSRSPSSPGRAPARCSRGSRTTSAASRRSSPRRRPRSSRT